MVGTDETGAAAPGNCSNTRRPFGPNDLWVVQLWSLALLARDAMIHIVESFEELLYGQVDHATISPASIT